MYRRFAPKFCWTAATRPMPQRRFRPLLLTSWGNPAAVLRNPLCIPSMCAAKPIWPHITAPKPQPSSENPRRRGIVLNEPIGALARLQIARAYAMQGDTAKAKAAYQDFLTLWKDADPDIPILKAAKAEYAKLQ